MAHDKLYVGSTEHYGEFPQYVKEQKVKDNGDIFEDFRQLSPEECKKYRTASVYSDLGNGFLVPDVSHLDKFQAMDALEQAIDSIDIEQFKEE